VHANLCGPSPLVGVSSLRESVPLLRTDPGLTSLRLRSGWALGYLISPLPGLVSGSSIDAALEAPLFHGAVRVDLWSALLWLQGKPPQGLKPVAVGALDAALKAPLFHDAACFRGAALPPRCSSRRSSRRSSTAPQASTALREVVTVASTFAYEFVTVATHVSGRFVHAHSVRDIRRWRDRGRAALPGPR
jgi:hypothetical protein